MITVEIEIAGNSHTTICWLQYAVESFSYSAEYRMCTNKQVVGWDNSKVTKNLLARIFVAEVQLLANTAKRDFVGHPPCNNVYKIVFLNAVHALQLYLSSL